MATWKKYVNAIPEYNVSQNPARTVSVLPYSIQSLQEAGKLLAAEKGGQKSGLQGGQKNDDKTINAILQLISTNPRITRKDIAKQLCIASSAVQKHINRLKATKAIIRRGGDKGGYWEVLK